MALTAREWILLPQAEMESRKGELSPAECLKLRTELDMVHFTEEEKRNMSAEEKYRFTHPQEYTNEEKQKAIEERESIFAKMAEEARK